MKAVLTVKTGSQKPMELPYLMGRTIKEESLLFSPLLRAMHYMRPVLVYCVPLTS